MDANVSFSGNLGTEVDYVEGRGWCAARFRVAHTPRRLVDGAWVDGNTTWLTVRTSGRLARNCRDSLVKGDPIIVSGRLRTKVWRDSDDKEHESLAIVASSVGHDLARGCSEFRRVTRDGSSSASDVAKTATDGTDGGITMLDSARTGEQEMASSSLMAAAS